MFKKKCPACAKKIDSKFNYCPWCGKSIKAQQNKENYGLLGKDDSSDGNLINQQLNLPFGMNKIMGSLIKQLEKELSNVNNKNNSIIPRGLSIKIATGHPQIKQITPKTNSKEQQNFIPPISLKENLRRAHLPKEEAESKRDYQTKLFMK